MTSTLLTDPGIRDGILADPAALLDDPEILGALMYAEDNRRGSNVIDLRGAAMERLEDRLGRLQDVHQSVISAAYENLSGMALVHRAALLSMEPDSLPDFLATLALPVREALKVDSLRLVAETDGTGAFDALRGYEDVLALAERGFCSLYAARGRGGAPEPVTLRAVSPADPEMHGPAATEVRSEACLLLDTGGLPAMLVLGSADGQHFAAGQGTDLLHFLGEVMSRTLTRLLK